MEGFPFESGYAGRSMRGTAGKVYDQRTEGCNGDLERY